MSLRLKVMSIALGLAILIGLVASVEMRRGLEAKLDEELEVGVVGVARTIASSLAAFDRPPPSAQLLPALWRVQRVNPDVRYVCVVRADGQLVADTVPYHLRKHVTFHNQDSPRQPFQVRRFAVERDTIREVSLPVEGGWGLVQVGMSEQRMRELVTDATRRFLRTLSVIALLGVAAAALVTHWVTLPITQLAGVARAVERGDRHQRAARGGPDEVGRLSEAFNAMLDSLQLALQRNEALLGELHEKEQARVELLRQLLSAQEDERRRISRELHDETAQLLASLLAGLSALAATAEQEAGRSQARALLALTEQTMSSLRKVALRLRPDELESLGLVASLRQRFEDSAQRLGVPTQIAAVGLDDASLPLETETALYRIIGEAVANAARHAHAENVSIVIERRGADLVALVEDDGDGFDVCEVNARPIKQRLGLFGMTERAALVGAEVTVESEKGGGTTVRITCPIRVEGA